LLALGYVLFAYNLGFPDGYVTEYGQAGKLMYEVLVLPSIVLIVYLIYVGNFTLESNKGVKLLIAALIMTLIVILTIVLDLYFFATMDHGLGG